MKRRIVLSIVLILSVLVFSPSALAEEEVIVPQDEIKDECYSQLTATQLTQEKVTVPKSWVKESYFEEEQSDEETKEPDAASTNWRWGLEKINAPGAWEHTKGEGVVIAVIDGGVNFEHPALEGKAWVNEDEIPDNSKDDDKNGYVDDIHGWDFIDNDPRAKEGSDFHGHGTSMADVASGNLTSAGRGGVAPKAKIMDLRLMDADDNAGSWNDFVNAFEYALDNGADIINFSIGFDFGTSLDYFFKKAIRETSKKILIFGVVSNESSSVAPPATMEEIAAVTATDRFDRVYTNANQGPEVAFAAPGKDIMQAEKRGYDTASGTSLAVPHVAGTAALVLSANPSLEPDQVYEILVSTAQDLGPEGRDEKFGYGLVDAEAAVEKALEIKEKEEKD